MKSITVLPAGSRFRVQQHPQLARFNIPKLDPEMWTDRGRKLCPGAVAMLPRCVKEKLDMTKVTYKKNSMGMRFTWHQGDAYERVLPIQYFDRKGLVETHNVMTKAEHFMGWNRGRRYLNALVMAVHPGAMMLGDEIMEVDGSWQLWSKEDGSSSGTLLKQAVTASLWMQVIPKKQSPKMGLHYVTSGAFQARVRSRHVRGGVLATVVGRRVWHFTAEEESAARARRDGCR